MSGPKPVPIEVTDAQRRALEAIVNRNTHPHALVVPPEIFLMAYHGHATRHIARHLHTSEDRVCYWKQRWRECATPGLGETQVRDWLSDAPKSGKPPTITAEQWCQIMALAISDPKDSDRPISHWTLREVRDEAVQRQIVPTLSLRHLERFFQRNRAQTAP